MFQGSEVREGAVSPLDQFVFGHLSCLEMIIQQGRAVASVHVLAVLLLGRIPLQPIQILTNININMLALTLLTSSAPTFRMEEAQSCT